MKKTLFIAAIFLILLVMPIVFAERIDTVVKINAEEEEVIVLRAIDPITGSAIQTINLETDEEGKTDAVVNSELASLSFRLLTITDAGAVKEAKDFGPYPTGGILTLNFVEPPEEVEEVTANETEETETVENTTTEETDATLTGGVITKLKEFFQKQKTIIYVIVSCLIIVTAGIFISKRYKRLLPKGINIIKLSDLTKTNAKSEFEDAQEKLKEAQKEMEELKQKEKIFELEEKIEKERQELDKMRRND